MDKEEKVEVLLPTLQETNQKDVANESEDCLVSPTSIECPDFSVQTLQSEKKFSPLLTQSINNQANILDAQNSCHTLGTNESAGALSTVKLKINDDAAVPATITELCSTLTRSEVMEGVQVVCSNLNSAESLGLSTKSTAAQPITDLLSSAIDQNIGSNKSRLSDGKDGLQAIGTGQKSIDDAGKLPDQNSPDGEMVFSMVEIGEIVTATGPEEQVCSSDSDSDSTDSSDSSSSSDETSSDESCTLKIRHKDIELLEENAALKNDEPPKVKGEILPKELPLVDDLNISLPDDAVLESVGKVSHIMDDHSVVVQSYPGKPALDFETVLFLSRQVAIGKVDETFGPVPSPYYIVRFNSLEHLESKGIELEKEVFYAPHIKDFTSFVFVAALRQIRGSDASWCNDVEPPPSCCDYSDDEQEREMKKKRKNRDTESGNKKDTSSGSLKGSSDSCRVNVTNQRGRGRGRNRWHNESRRFNVLQTPEPAQMMWQAAVNDMSRPRHAFRGPCVPPPTPDLLTCFQRPPMEMLRHRGLPQTQFLGHFPPPVRWNQPPPQFRPPMYGFGPPPPPPPPP